MWSHYFSREIEDETWANVMGWVSRAETRSYLHNNIALWHMCNRFNSKPLERMAVRNTKRNESKYITRRTDKGLSAFDQGELGAELTPICERELLP